MAERKKIILFIVEGITDMTCLGFALSQILNSHKVEFQITGGDITTDQFTDARNVPVKIADAVKGFSGKIFKARDFCEIVHLVDTDGAYIADNQILEKTSETPVDPGDVKRLYYTDNQIFVNNIGDTQRRNQKKASILNRLISLSSVWATIPYSLYFFSCNLDHVMHGERNLLSKDKFVYADALNAQFEVSDGGVPKFIEFINAPDIVVQGNFEETWTFIKADSNSLKRFTNFHLFFSNPKNSREVLNP